jgi:CcmD family protein
VTKAGIIAVLFGLAATVLVIFAVTSREMSGGQYLMAAYAITAVILVGYIVSLTARLDRAEKDEAARK